MRRDPAFIGPDSRWGHIEDRACPRPRPEGRSRAVVAGGRRAGLGLEGVPGPAGLGRRARLAGCATDCSFPCTVMTQFGSVDQARLSGRAASALAYQGCALVRLRHRAPVGHGFGVPSREEVAEAWEREPARHRQARRPCRGGPARRQIPPCRACPRSSARSPAFRWRRTPSSTTPERGDRSARSRWHRVVTSHRPKWNKRRLLPTTLTLDSAIAAAANIGVISPAAADRDHRRVVGERPDEVGPDGPKRGTGKGDRVGRRPQISHPIDAADHGQVARVDRHVRSRAHGDAQIRRGQRGGVVDPVAHHRDDPALPLQGSHGVDLVGW